jgi:hypothetical protein
MTRRKKRPPDIDLDGLLCALVLVPRAFSRNRFYSLYDSADTKRVRRRATRVRGVVRQLLGLGRPKAEVVGEQILEDGQLLLRYRIPDLAFERATALTPLEAASLRYALHRAGEGKLSRADRALVHQALERLGRDLDLPPDSLRPVPPR